MAPQGDAGSQVTLHEANIKFKCSQSCRISRLIAQRKWVSDRQLPLDLIFEHKAT
ncbi:hypothetical protein [Planktothrix agardhii]|uniref:hypothetical protein n=1 Tax=Planktothrix agardhii TaxID=1160 RepID=UPI001BDFAAAB|nr:hypothetical protein [Planktothrix agardhii]